MNLTRLLFYLLLVGTSFTTNGCAGFLCVVGNGLGPNRGIDECLDALDDDICGIDPPCISLLHRDAVPPETQPAIRCQVESNFSCTANAGDTNFCTPLLADGGFEMNTYRAGIVPNQPGYWEGDVASVLTENAIADTGIRSCDGSYLLRFDGTTNQGASPNTGASEVFQAIDLMADSTAIRSGGVKAVASALFTRIDFDAETDEQFELTLMAFEGEIGRLFFDFRSGLWLASENVRIAPEVRNTPAWTEALLELELPTTTTHLLLQLRAIENVHVDGEQPEFDGHFVDAVRLELSR